MRKKNQSVEFIKICLADALIQLMYKFPFDDINIKDICAKSGVGRTTYYRHFDNKRGKKNLLLFKACNAWEHYNHTKEPKDSNNAFLCFVYENKEFFKLMRKNEIYDVLIEMLLMFFGPEDNCNIQDLYFKSYGASAYYGIINQWIKRDFRESPREIQNLVISSFKKVFEEAHYVKAT